MWRPDGIRRKQACTVGMLQNRIADVWRCPAQVEYGWVDKKEVVLTGWDGAAEQQRHEGSCICG